MDSLQAIRSATPSAVEALGMSTEIGRIEAGLQADLIAVAGDPTTDVRLLETIPVVIQAGKLVKDERKQ